MVVVGVGNAVRCNGCTWQGMRLRNAKELEGKGHILNLAKPGRRFVSLRHPKVGYTCNGPSDV